MIGVHISKTNGEFHEQIPELARKWGFGAFQIFVIGPQNLKISHIDIPATASAIRAEKAHVYIHSSYLVRPWGVEAYNLPMSIKQLKISAKLGALGVVFHLPNMPLADVVPGVMRILTVKPAGARVIWENAALKNYPENSFSRPEQLNALVDGLLAAGAKLPDIHFCIDTSHLYCSGVDLRTASAARGWFAALKYPATIRLFHLNGNASTSHIDVHAVPMSTRDVLFTEPRRTSGLTVIRKFAKKSRCDIILECNLEAEKVAVRRLLKSGMV